jgi:hypothetical protein
VRGRTLKWWHAVAASAALSVLTVLLTLWVRTEHGAVQVLHQCLALAGAYAAGGWGVFGRELYDRTRPPQPPPAPWALDLSVSTDLLKRGTQRVEHRPGHARDTHEQPRARYDPHDGRD